MSTGKIAPGVLCVMNHAEVFEENVGRLVEVMHAGPHPMISISGWWIRFIGNPGMVGGRRDTVGWAKEYWLHPIDGLTDDEIAHIKAGEPEKALA